MAFCDVHFHLSDTLFQCGTELTSGFFSEDVFAATCAHSPDEFMREESFIREHSLETKIVQCFGIHPQMPTLENADFLETLLKEKKIAAIGETGHDFFTQELKSSQRLQSECFSICLELALAYGVPMIIHNRKALEKIFENGTMLKKLPFVLFHSFAFSSVEAKSILRKGINGYFSFSKQICNGNKKAVSCVRDLDNERVLYETDAPFQTLKGETCTLPSDVKKVYEKASEIKKVSLETLCRETRDSFFRLFGL